MTCLSISCGTGGLNTPWNTILICLSLRVKGFLRRPRFLERLPELLWFGRRRTDRVSVDAGKVRRDGKYCGQAGPEPHAHLETTQMITEPKGLDDHGGSFAQREVTLRTHFPPTDWPGSQITGRAWCKRTARLGGRWLPSVRGGIPLIANGQETPLMQTGVTQTTQWHY